MPKILVPAVASVLSGLGLGAATFLPAAIVSALGFQATGVLAGSFAAAWQSSIGNVVAGSTFAGLQSAGATGAFFPPVALAVGVGVVGAAGVFGSYFGIKHLVVKNKQKQWDTEHQKELRDLRRKLHVLESYVYSAE
eukprot:TRINITY_DN577_c0_g4_i1.p2 TRINITY_DN577_c0_g4~~TRINITY_DN577_c0_g4_i1.p2  ORF type:complete len:146 (-),score=29.20 TRINITY_DN577_c0_g4_i1:564-974(-)